MTLPRSFEALRLLLPALLVGVTLACEAEAPTSSSAGGAGGTLAGAAGALAGGSAGSAGSGGSGGSTVASGGAGAGGSGGTSGGGTSGGGGVSGGGAGGSAGASGGGGTGGSSSAFQPCPAAEPCKILPLGDSITDGFGTPGGYRIELFSLALAGDKSITFVGGETNGPSTVDGQPFPSSHEGHSGWTIQQVDDDLVPEPALDVTPHIILLHIGTNDMFQGSSSAPAKLEALVDQILDGAPDALLVVAQIIPFPGAGNAVETFNATIPALVEERANAGKHVVLVDQFTGFTEDELDDGVHPNPEGYALMATRWYAAIESYLH